MDFRGDRRGVTVQIGAVLLFGILIISLATYQATVVPSQTEAVEFQQSLETQRDMAELRNAIVRGAARGSLEPVSVTLGTDYPDRALFINPPPATGTLATAGTADPAANLTIANAVALDPEVRDHWDGSTHVWETGFVVYRPDFNEYADAPTVVYANTVVYNRFDDGTTLASSGQGLVDGRRINLVALDGNLSETRVGAVQVDVRPLSAAGETVAVRNASEPIVLTLPTLMTEESWGSLLAGEERVQNWSYTEADPYNLVRIELEPGVVYELDAALMGVGAVKDASPQAEYLASMDGFDDVTAGTGERGSVTVQVRDRFNNPVSNVTVQAEGDASITVVDPEQTSDERGLVTFEYTGDQVSNDATLNVTIRDGNTPEERVVYTGRVTQDGGGGLGSASGSIRLDSHRTQGQTTAIVTLANTGGLDVNVTRAQLVFYAETSQNGFSRADLLERNSGTVSATLQIGGSFEELDPEITVPANGQVELEFQFEPTNAKFNDGEYFILTLEYSNGETDTYFIPVS